MSGMVLFFLSAIPFFFGDLGTVKGCQIPFASQNSTNSLEVNSPPRLDLMALIWYPLSFSTTTLNFLNASKTFDFYFKKCTQVFLEKASIKKKDVVTFIKGAWLKWTAHISMNELKWILSSCV